jgi:hypothetical protein
MTLLSRAFLSALTLCAGGTLAAGAVNADPHSGSVPLADQHAPAGVMFDHMHKAGGFMVGYRYAAVLPMATSCAARVLPTTTRSRRRAAPRIPAR